MRGKKKKIPTPVTELSEKAMEWWELNVPVYIDLYPKYTSVDLNNWTQMASWWEKIQIAEADLKENGQKMVYPNGTVGTNPSFDMLNKAQKQYSNFLEAYGLTPNAKAKMERKIVKNEQDSLDNQEKALVGMLKK